MNPIKPTEYELLRVKLYQWSGINLGDSKTTLVESRLAPRIAELGLSSFAQYVAYLREHPYERTAFVNCMTTNKTDWFREPDHFDFLKKNIAGMLHGLHRPLLIWSAACSTGEEVYSLAIHLRENFGETHGFRILGSDIDTEVLATASAGIYKKDLLAEQVPKHLLLKYFEPVHGSESGQLRAREELRSGLKFRNFNLIQSDWPVAIEFDVIFMRNVLIYFDAETCARVVQRVCRNLRPGGLLFVGHSEALNGRGGDHLKQVSESVYLKAA